VLSLAATCSTWPWRGLDAPIQEEAADGAEASGHEHALGVRHDGFDQALDLGIAERADPLDGADVGGGDGHQGVGRHQGLRHALGALGPQIVEALGQVVTELREGLLQADAEQRQRQARGRRQQEGHGWMIDCAGLLEGGPACGLDPRFGHPAETTVDALCWRGEDASPRMR